MKETGGSMKSRSLWTHWDMYQKDAWILSRREPVRPQGYHDALSLLFERQRDSHLVSWNNFLSWSYKEVDDETNRTKNWKPLPLLKDTARHKLGVVLRLRTCWYRMRAFHNGKAMPDWAVNPPTNDEKPQSLFAFSRVQPLNSIYTLAIRHSNPFWLCLLVL